MEYGSKVCFYEDEGYIFILVGDSESYDIHYNWYGKNYVNEDEIIATVKGIAIRAPQKGLFVHIQKEYFHGKKNRLIGIITPRFNVVTNEVLKILNKNDIMLEKGDLEIIKDVCNTDVASGIDVVGGILGGIVSFFDTL